MSEVVFIPDKTSFSPYYPNLLMFYCIISNSNCLMQLHEIHSRNTHNVAIKRQ